MTMEKLKRVNASQHSQWHDAMTSRDILQYIFQYQNGVYEDLLVFSNLDVPSPLTTGLVLNSKEMDRMHAMDKIFTTWYALHSSTGLSRMFVCMPHMRSIIAFYSVAFGKNEVLRYMHEKHPTSIPRKIFEVAVTFSQIGVLEYLTNTGIYIATSRTMDVAAIRGELDIVQWLHHNRTEGCTTNAIDGAATWGHLNVIKWLHQHRSEGATQDAMDGAAIHGFLNVVMWLHKHRSEGCTTTAMDGAARNGHLRTVKWLHFNRSEGCTELALVGAALSGHLKIVQFLYTHGYTQSALEAATIAKQNGRFDTFNYLIGEIAHENCFPTEDLIRMIAATMNPTS